MKIIARDITYINFAIVVGIVFVANFLSPDLNITYWLLLLGFSIMFIWILIKSVPEKLILLLSTFGMLAGSILVELHNLTAIVFGMILFYGGLLFFVFRIVE